MTTYVFLKMANILPAGVAERYNYFQIEKDKDLNDMHSIKNVSALEIAAIPETSAF